MRCLFDSSLVKILTLALVNSIAAQQFFNSDSSFVALNISSSCLATLGATILCDDSLLTAIDGNYPTDSQLSSLCVDTCSTSLQEYKLSLSESCTISDVLSFGDTSYPATLHADFFISSLDMICRRDETSDDYCATLFESWADISDLTSDQECSDCALGVQQLQLNSSFHYLPDLASAFAFTTTSCQDTAYTYTKPALALLDQTSTSTLSSPVPTSCTSTYTVQSGDNCTLISQANNVSTFALLFENGLEAYCNNFPIAGTPLCMPEECVTHTVLSDETCQSIAASVPENPSTADLISWNLNINSACSNLYQIIGTQICVSPPDGYSHSNTIISPTSTTSSGVSSTSSITFTDPCIMADAPTSCWQDKATLQTAAYWRPNSMQFNPAIFSD